MRLKSASTCPHTVLSLEDKIGNFEVINCTITQKLENIVTSSPGFPAFSAAKVAEKPGDEARRIVQKQKTSLVPRLSLPGYESG